MIDDIYDSAAGLANALDRVVDKFEDETDKVVRGTTLKVFVKIVKDTPEETRRAKTGWILTSSTPSDYEPPELPKGEKYPVPEPERQDPGEAENKKYWMVNNLEYIEPLEDGHSDQAPTGMVANALNAFEKQLNDQLDGMETIK